MFALLLLSFAPPLVEDSTSAKPLGCIPADHEPVFGTLRCTPDGAQFACVVSKGKKQYPFSGGKPGAAFDLVDAPVLHKSGAHVAFRAVKNGMRESKVSIVFDGKVIAEDDWTSDVVLSPADGTPAFWITHGWINNADGSLTNGPGVVQLGKAKGKKWQGNLGGPPSFPDDGKFAVCVGSKGGGSSVFRIDMKGKEDELAANDQPYLEAVVSPDGREFACSYRTSSPKESWSDEVRTFGVGRARVGESKPGSAKSISARYESAGSPVYSADSSHVAFKILDEGKFGVSLDGAMGAKCEYDFVASLVISPAGDAVAYAAGLDCQVSERRGYAVLSGTRAVGNRWFVVYGQEKSREYTAVGEPTWSSDGGRLAFAGCIRGEWQVVVGQNTSPPYSEVAGLVWSADGKSISYASRIGMNVAWTTFAVD